MHTSPYILSILRDFPVPVFLLQLNKVSFYILGRKTIGAPLLERKKYFNAIAFESVVYIFLEYFNITHNTNSALYCYVLKTFNVQLLNCHHTMQ